MTKETAKAWKEAFIQNVITQDPLTFGSYTEFLKNIHKAFAAADIEGVLKLPFNNFAKEMEPLTTISHNSEACLEEPK